MDEDAGRASADDDIQDDGAPDDGAPDDDIQDDGAPDDSSSMNDTADDESGDPEGSVAGPFAPDLPIEPEAIDTTNVAFVLLGAYVGMVAIAAFMAPFLGPQGRLDVWTIAWLTLAFAVVAGLAYAFFARTSADPSPDNPDT